MSKSCTSTINGDFREFSCSLSQECCGVKCCDPSIQFYSHWYFWLAVAAFGLFLIGAIMSAYCRCKGPPYKELNSESRHNSAEPEPRICVLDKDSWQSNRKQFQLVHTSRPFMYSYRNDRCYV